MTTVVNQGDIHSKDYNFQLNSISGALVKAFATVIKELWSPDLTGPVNTAALKSQIQRFAPRFMGYSQQDAQEFLRYLLEGKYFTILYSMAMINLENGTNSLFDKLYCILNKVY